jgi:hypothetical protein
MEEKACTNEGISAAAWNKGGYCFTSKSVISQLPYLGFLGRVWWHWGVYMKVCSFPDIGSITGGKKVSAVCGILKVMD